MALAFWRRAEQDPDWTALIEPDGTRVTAGELLARVNQLTHVLRALGLRPGDGIAGVLPNGSAALEVYLAALQGGWYYTPINWHFTAPEIAYIVADCEAKAFFVHERYAAAGAAAADQAGVPGQRAAQLRRRARVHPGPQPAGRPAGQLPADRTAGSSMHYTSGTTGRPKGVRRPLSGLDPDEAAELTAALLQLFGVPSGQPNVHLVTSPNYHTAVTVFGASAIHLGHTLAYLDAWDAEQALACVERYQVTSTHMVPTHFKRMLSLPEETRRPVRPVLDALAAARRRALPGAAQAGHARLVGTAWCTSTTRPPREAARWPPRRTGWSARARWAGPGRSAR